MAWEIGSPSTLIGNAVRAFVTKVRSSAAAAAETIGTAPPEVSAEKLSDPAPCALPDTLRLRPEVEKPLLDAGMPPEASLLYNGPKRAADTPDGAARKFVLWARAVGATGSYSARTISALYWECAEVDHREPVAIDRFLRALKNARGVRHDESTADRRRRVWIIEPAEPKRVVKAQAVIASKLLPQPQRNVVQQSAQEPDYSSPQLLRATAHDARRQGRARKQRGSRNVRWAA
jgi:hypothetical protein